MHKPPPALAATRSRSVLSPEQKSWLKQLGSLVSDAGGGNGGDGPVLAAGGQLTDEPAGAKAVKSDLVAGFDPIDLLKTQLGPRTATCKINNRTDRTIVLDPRSLNDQPEHGEFKTPVPDEIDAKQTGEFLAVNKKIPLIGDLLDLSATGAEGEIRYFVDDKRTIWTIKFNNPRVGKNTAASTITGPDKEAVARFEPPSFFAGPGNEATFVYTLKAKGGGGTEPPADTKASCLITVNNQTQSALTLADQDHEFGDFQTQPPASIEPGASASFGSTETPKAKDHRCKGFVSWEVGSPVAAIWRIEWDNPVAERNSAKSTAEPQSAGFRTINQAGQGDENVPFIFTISGGPDGPGPGPKPEEDDAVAPPPGSRQPTLRKGDKSPDGWVEFLQVQLNHHLGLKLEVNGDFDATVEKAVRKFQADHDLLKDGVVGNQTWAALREDTPEKPSTDGRKPHTFEEKGPEARFDNEKVDGEYSRGKDQLLLFVASVGEEPIDKFHIHVHVTPPDGPKVSKKFVIGPPVSNKGVENQPGGGAQHQVKIANFKKIFLPKGSKANVSECKFEAFFDAELGPDVFRGTIQEKP